MKQVFQLLLILVSSVVITAVAINIYNYYFRQDREKIVTMANDYCKCRASYPWIIDYYDSAGFAIIHCADGSRISFSDDDFVKCDQ